MEEKVLNFVNENKLLDVGDRILIGVSGGPDSIALFHFLYSIRENFGLEIAVCHLNHMIRGKEANEDEKFVRDLCEKNKIAFYSKRCEVERLAKERKITVEEAGREERYKFFYYLKQKLGIDKIALAHHLDDNVETILMRFLRGTGVKGLRGIVPMREDRVIRPFLSVQKREILEYCKIHKLSTKLDKTNLEAKYHRNKLRLEVIPYLEKFNPNFAQGVSQLGNISTEYYDFVQKCAKAEVKRITIDGKIDIKKFNDLHICLKREVLIEVLRKTNKKISLEYHHIDLVLNKLKDKHNTVWGLDLPNRIKVIRQYDYLFAEIHRNRREINSFCYELTPGKVLLLSKLHCCCSMDIMSMDVYRNLNPKPFGAVFDYDKILEQGKHLLLRSRKEGDRIEPMGMQGTKKVKDIFIDKKIPAERRWEIPLLCVDNNVIWIVGYHKSRRFKLNEDTQNVLIVSFDYYEEA
ncbi:tRNA(Ile)-lysidine synthase [Alkalibaculum bacchi]|uniref:tRNA(Ile)-lysidine synthase n=1 Tax=Alkalibaculum bacchi TaxID=645887 RepID=A0A366IB57_9FIRM|nr:tRNA lysidine(34) synthetase TilS [Alkalibaculum bacchi]RBP67480.1 tRNA(Ile)-lysidine synthase [Alkalibaculum bacchi]